MASDSKVQQKPRYICVQKGPFDSSIVSVDDTMDIPTTFTQSVSILALEYIRSVGGALAKTLDGLFAERKAELDKNPKAPRRAIFVHVTRHQYRCLGEVIDAREFRLYGMNAKKQTIQFVGHEPDNLPEYMTSIEGVAAIVLSPNAEQVLLAFEYGKWKAITGAVAIGESPMTTVVREVAEEVGVTLVDGGKHMAWVGAWQFNGARGGAANDNAHAFVVQATSLDFKPDGKEIHVAKWWDVKTLLPLLTEFKTTGRPANAPPLFADSVEFKGEKISLAMVRWLHIITEGRTRPIVSDGKTMMVF